MLKLIAENIGPSLSAGAPLRLIHIGSGNGVEIPIFLTMFKLGKRDSYVAVDVSSELLNIVRARQGVVLESVLGNVSYLTVDVEMPNSLSNALAKCPAAKGVVSVIVASGEGTLLSNVAVLSHFRSCITDRGYLMLSLDGIESARISRVCEEYDRPEVREFLINAVNFAFDTGAIESKEGEFLPAYYQPDLSQLIVKYRLRNGTELLLLRSWKPQNENAIEKVFEQNGFSVIRIERLDGAYGILAQ